MFQALEFDPLFQNPLHHFAVDLLASAVRIISPELSTRARDPAARW